MKISVCLAIFFLSLAIPASCGYHTSLRQTYSGSNFFSQFNFYTGNDPTNGYVNYVSQAQATAAGLISVNNDGTVTVGTDTTNVASGRGRNSVRLESKTTYNAGTLIIADIAHMPTGCGTWPAFWSFGPNWPTSGEIDIIEGVNNAVANSQTLHTDDGCAMSSSYASQMSGTWGANMYGGPSDNCYVNAANQWSNAGCGITGATGSYGPGFNTGNGGVYATLWTTSEIAIYYFARSAIPSNIKSGSPDPETWGKPVALFQIGTNCPSSHFANHQIIINLTYCGDWAGNVFSSMCPGLANGNCASYVQNNPSAFTEAYWKFNSIKIYSVAL